MSFIDFAHIFEAEIDEAKVNELKDRLFKESFGDYNNSTKLRAIAEFAAEAIKATTGGRTAIAHVMATIMCANIQVLTMDDDKHLREAAH